MNASASKYSQGSRFAIGCALRCLRGKVRISVTAAIFALVHVSNAQDPAPEKAETTASVVGDGATPNPADAVTTAPPLPAPSRVNVQRLQTGDTPQKVLQGIKLTWEEVDGASGYRVYRQRQPGSPFELLKDLSPDQLEVSDPDPRLLWDPYAYTVAAVDASQREGERSEELRLRQKRFPAGGSAHRVKDGTAASVQETESSAASGSGAAPIPRGDLPAPAKVDMERLQAGGNTPRVLQGVKITWEKVDGASGYRVYRQARPGSMFELLKEVSSLQHEVTDAEPRLLWDRFAYTVVAIDAAQREGERSEELRLRPKRSAPKPGAQAVPKN